MLSLTWDLTCIMQATSLCSTDTEFSADCIEFCPHEGYQHIFVCGTYQVLEPRAEFSKAAESHDQDKDVLRDDEDEDEAVPRQTQRTGRLLLFQVNEDQTSFTELQRIDTAAILDAKWSPQMENNHPVLTIGDAKGGLTRYTLTTYLRLEEIERVDIAEDTVLSLSLDYAHSKNSTSNDIITSLSSGHLTHLQPTPTGYLPISTFQAHKYEPWTCAFDQFDPNRIWSGGDDCVLKAWDTRMAGIATGTSKGFDAGVTTVVGSEWNEYLLAVGSYDANLRLFDTRHLSSPIRIIPCAGGIWRTKFHPSSSRKGDILLACMHGGFSAVRLDESIIGLPQGTKWDSTGDEQGTELVKRFEGHDSLAYGADWCRLSPKDGGSLVGSCSFYDHTMHMWRA